MTGALELALAGDIILAAESARFADTHAKWGFTSLWGMSQRLPRRVGRSKALEMSFTCRFYSGKEAEAMGLANICVEDDALDAEVDRWAMEITTNSWFTHSAHKKLLRETDGLGLNARLAHEFHYTPGHAPDSRQRIEQFTSRSKS